MEKLLYPPKVYQGNEEVDYDLFQDTKARKKVGDKLCHTFAAPGCGHVSYEITRIDETGVYAKEIENTLHILSIEECR